MGRQPGRDDRAKHADRLARCIAAVLVANLAIAALVLLMPLKRVEPFVIRVDNTTGVVDVVPVLAGEAEIPSRSRGTFSIIT